jgi:hypothetical protein
MSIFQKIFGAAPNTQTHQTAQGQVVLPAAPNNAPQNNLQVPPNQQTQQTQVTAPNGVVPQNDASDPTQAPSPLTKFEKVWETPVVDPNKPDPNGPAVVSPDPAKIMAAAAQVDFTKIISQDDLAKITAGGPEATQALVAILGKQGQEIFGRSMQATAKIVENAVGTAEERFNQRLPQAVNRVNARGQLLSENPAFQNPAVAPLIEMVQNQLALKHPNASPQELAALSKEYMQAAAGVFNPAKPQAAATGPKDEDWSAYMN